MAILWEPVLSAVFKVICMHGLVLLVLLLWLAGCSNTPEKLQVEPEWLLSYRGQPVGEICLPPVGRFESAGVASREGAAVIPLPGLLFDDGLAGYPVEQVEIKTDEQNGALQMRGVLAGVPLKNFRVLSVSQGRCEDHWSLVVDTGAVNASLRTAAVLYTGGLLMPLSEKFHIALIRAEDGALLVRVREVAWVLGAFAVPVRLEDEFWLRYPLSESVAAEVVP